MAWNDPGIGVVCPFQPDDVYTILTWLKFKKLLLLTDRLMIKQQQPITHTSNCLIPLTILTVVNHHVWLKILYIEAGNMHKNTFYDSRNQMSFVMTYLIQHPFLK